MSTHGSQLDLREVSHQPLSQEDLYTEHTVRPQSLRVCLLTEGSYPHYRGGVSNWCDMLVRGLPEIRFELISLVADPSAKPVYDLPTNVANLTPLPLWGIGEVMELRRDLGLLNIIRRKHSAPPFVIEQEFLQLFSEFLHHIWDNASNTNALVKNIQAMAAYFEKHDYDVTMRSRLVWETFRDTSVTGYMQSEVISSPTGPPSLYDVTDGMRLLYRYLTVLTVPIPDVDVVHAASAGLCSIIGIVAAAKPKTAFLLTEHGVYLRERLLALTRSEGSHFNKIFQARFAQRITEASYQAAAQISPGSNYNHRWEIYNGAKPDNIQTIYNGPDPEEFTPSEINRSHGKSPIVVFLGRIDPLKDIETLIRAAAIVIDQMPEVRFVLYGTAPKGNEWYYEKCLALRDQLGVQDNVIFGGFAASAAAAYNEGDFVVLSSISEGFPYSVVEAMMCARTVVATDVGGVSEALEGCGIVVEPRNPEELAKGCLTLLRDPDQTRELGQLARNKALHRFSLQQCNAAYLATYQRLATLYSTGSVIPRHPKQLPKRSLRLISAPTRTRELGQLARKKARYRFGLRKSNAVHVTLNQSNATSDSTVLAVIIEPNHEGTHVTLAFVQEDPKPDNDIPLETGTTVKAQVKRLIINEATNESG